MNPLNHYKDWTRQEVEYIKESTRSPIISTDNKDYLQFIISHIRNKSLTALLSE